MALLQLMLDLQRLHAWKIRIWHGDHGWHEQSGSIAKELKNWCKSKNLDYFCAQTTKIKTKSEASARDWRYQQLLKTAEKISAQNISSPCQHIVTGHTASDRTETLLLNLARGADLAGISSLKDTRKLNQNINLVRPLLVFSRQETAQICQEMKLPIWIDPSNKNTNLSRNRVRQEIIPVLEDLHPGSSLRISSLAERLSDYKANQQAMARLLLERLSSGEGICRQSLLELPLTARTTVLSAWLQQHGAPGLTAVQLEELSDKIGKSKPPGSLHLAKNWTIKWIKNLILIEEPKTT